MRITRENLHFVLVRTQFASNLGSTVRIMKNMGFSNLTLVQPQCEVGMEARSFAMRGADLLDRALFYPSLESTLERFGLLVGTTGRFKGKNPRRITCRTLASEVLPRLGSVNVGIVFGSEDNGMRREEIRLCQWLVEIPTGSDYPIINLAQAAAIVAYELNLTLLNAAPGYSLNQAGPQAIETLMHRTERTIETLNLSDRLSVRRLMQRIRRITARAQLETEDVNMLHGLLRELLRQEVRPGSSKSCTNHSEH